MLVASSARIFFYVSPFAGFFLDKFLLQEFFWEIVTPLSVISKAPCKRTQHCWLTTPNIVGCYMLRPFAHPVACCWAKFETGQTFQPTTPNISFVPWSPKRGATMLYPFSQLFQHCWGHARSLRMDYKDLWVVFFPRCTEGPKLVGSCCILLHTTANTNATTPNIVGATMLRVVAPVCTQP